MANNGLFIDHKSLFIESTMLNRFAHEKLVLSFFYGKNMVKEWNLKMLRCSILSQWC